MPKTTAERFFAKVDACGVCWEWTGAVMKDSGYGVFNLGREQGTTLAHRWAWEFLVGPIPDGLQRSTAKIERIRCGTAVRAAMPTR